MTDQMPRVCLQSAQRSEDFEGRMSTCNISLWSSTRHLEAPIAWHHDRRGDCNCVFELALAVFMLTSEGRKAGARLHDPLQQEVQFSQVGFEGMLFVQTTSAGKAVHNHDLPGRLGCFWALIHFESRVCRPPISLLSFDPLLAS